MKILVVGGGGREHALAWKLKTSPRLKELYCAPGNGGTEGIATNVNIKADDIDALLEFAKKEKIDLTVVGPEQPLVKGIVDLFKSNGLRIFGPTKAAAELEGSKAFMKDVLKTAGIPTADYKTFDNQDGALSYLDSYGKFPVVIKADGLAAGKGVFVAPDADSAKKFVKEVMGEKIFGESGSRIITEQFLDGEEASYIVVADGENFVQLATSQDHKRIGDNDTGPNTGGMGAYSPAPVVTPEIKDKIKKGIIEPLLTEMKKRGAPFTGFLYAGIMVVNGEPIVLEFNVRLGDPEAQPILARYTGDLVELLEAAIDGDVARVEPKWTDYASVCVVMASEGYPGSYEKGMVIAGLEEKDEIENVTVFHAGTEIKNGEVVTSGGRVLGVTATAPNIKDAAKLAYKRVASIKWDGAYSRKDIASRAISRQK
jgi:phosphoribosylamine--glycine ligase